MNPPNSQPLHPVTIIVENPRVTGARLAKLAAKYAPDERQTEAKRAAWAR